MSSELEQAEIASLRHLGVTGRLQMAFSMFDFARAIVRQTVQHQHPEWMSSKVDAEVVRRMMSQAKRP
jgi:hypothetical protein